MDETIRLRYRWLDMRREQMQRNLRLSHTIVQSIRRTMDGRDFIDVWTPGMTRGTPEGARDFLVPVRLQPGKFFAMAQSPQLFKQLCVIGGLDRYYQIATCWRDEDLRADRQFEFRQLDLEMAFVEREDVLDVLEQVVVGAFEAVGREPPARPFPRMGYDEAIAKYGTGQAGPQVRARDPGRDRGDARLRVRRLRQRGDSAVHRRPERVLARRARPPPRCREGVGGEGARLHRLRRRRRGPVSDREVPLRRGACGVRGGARLDRPLRRRRPGNGRARVLGGMRLHVARELGLASDDDVFHWVIDFPLFERDEDSGNWTFLHHPFTAPIAGDEGFEGEPGAAKSQHYDLIWNGWELGSGSIRIHRSDLQAAVFRVMGVSDEEVASKYGFLLEALEMGAPPHGGFAMGLERFVALMAGEPDIRQIVAFPKVSSGSDPLTGAPTTMPQEVLRELGIEALPQEEER